jgi:hypothetical protein
MEHWPHTTFGSSVYFVFVVMTEENTKSFEQDLPNVSYESLQHRNVPRNSKLIY